MSHQKFGANSGFPQPPKKTTALNFLSLALKKELLFASFFLISMQVLQTKILLPKFCPNIFFVAKTKSQANNNFGKLDFLAPTPESDATLLLF